jgi:hypothetical protein
MSTILPPPWAFLYWPPDSETPQPARMAETRDGVASLVIADPETGVWDRKVSAPVVTFEARAAGTCWPVPPIPTCDSHGEEG